MKFIQLRKYAFFFFTLSMGSTALSSELISGKYERVTPKTMAIVQEVFDKLNFKHTINCINYPHVEYAGVEYRSQPIPLLCINEDIMNSLTQDEIEFIIAHEVGHFILKHEGIIPLSFKSKLLLGLGAGLSIIASLKNPILYPLIGVANSVAMSTILYKEYGKACNSHQQEFEADEYAALALCSTKGAIRFLKRLGNFDDDSTLESHPSHRQRIQQLEQIQKRLDNRSLNDLD